MKWIVENWNDIVALIGAVVILARIIAKLTPSPKDDSILDGVASWLTLHIKDQQKKRK